MAIKPNLKCTQFGKFKAMYEEKIAVAEANIDKAVAECNAVISEHDKIMNEKNELNLALNSGGSAVQVCEHLILIIIFHISIFELPIKECMGISIYINGSILTL